MDRRDPDLDRAVGAVKRRTQGMDTERNAQVRSHRHVIGMQQTGGRGGYPGFFFFTLVYL